MLYIVVCRVWMVVLLYPRSIEYIRISLAVFSFKAHVQLVVAISRVKTKKGRTHFSIHLLHHSHSTYTREDI
jgi:hypothetical protein